MFNFWFCLLVVIIPIVVFCVKADTATRIQISRLVIGTMLGYVLILLAVYSHQRDAKVVMEEFYHRYPDCIDRRCDNDPKFYIVGPALGILIYLGWAVSALYVGVCELVWRIIHRKNVKTMGKTYKGKWMSNIFAGYAVFVFIVYPLCICISFSILVLFFDVPFDKIFVPLNAIPQ